MPKMMRMDRWRVARWANYVIQTRCAPGGGGVLPMDDPLHPLTLDPVGQPSITGPPDKHVLTEENHRLRDNLDIMIMHHDILPEDG